MIVVTVVGGGADSFLVLSISKEDCAIAGLGKASTSRMMPPRIMLYFLSAKIELKAGAKPSRDTGMCAVF